MKGKKWAVFAVMVTLGAALFTNPAASQSLRGDVNGDGIVDSKDALLVLRHVRGLVVLTSEQQARADVFPLPGVDGRPVGDGKVTEEDALRLLRHLVGLVPGGELTGQIEGPFITEFEPMAGGAGTQVTLRGVNFIAGSTVENVVKLSGAPCRTLSATGSELTVEVPQGAESGPFALTTPGGTTTSQESFVVTAAVSGRMTVPPGMVAQNFVVVGPLNEARPDREGRFQLELGDAAFTFISALPADGQENALWSVYVPESKEVLIDARSTAVALLLMHPGLLPSSDVPVAELINMMESLPEVGELTQVIAQIYPTHPFPLDEARFKESYVKAIHAVVDSPWMRNLSRRKATPPPSQRSMVSGSLRSLDIDTTWMELKENEDKPLLSLLNRWITPVDWIYTVTRIDPNQFEYGRESIMALNEENRLRIYDGEKDDLNRIERGQLGSRGFFALVNLASFIISYFRSGSFVPTTDVNLEEGVYVVRLFSGASELTDREEKKFARQNFPVDDVGAYALNAVGAGADIFAVLISTDTKGIKKILFHISNVVAKKFAQKGLLPPLPNSAKGQQARAELGSAMQKREGALDPLVELALSELLTTIFEALSDGFSDIADALSQEADIGKATRSMVLLTLKTTLKLYTSAAVFAAMGRVVERVTAMLGVNPTTSVTPLETALVVVGDPFSPRITGFPQRAAFGDEIVIKGQGFATKTWDNRVFFGDQEAPVTSAVPDGTEIKTTVPLRDTGPVNLTVRTPRGEATAGPVNLVRIPKIASLEPPVGFAATDTPPPDFGGPFSGTVVQLRGDFFEGFDEVIFTGNVAAKIEVATKRTLRFRVPTGARSGPLTVRTSDGQTSMSPSFTVLEAAPVVKSVQPSRGPTGATLELIGENFGLVKEEVGVFVGGRSEDRNLLSATTLTATVSTQLPPGSAAQPLDVRVVTPAGEHVLPGAFTLEAGMVEGSSMGVSTSEDVVRQDDFLSLREAILLATTGDAGHPLSLKEKYQINPWDEIFDAQGNLVDVVLLQPPGPNRKDRIGIPSSSEVLLDRPLPPLSSGYDTLEAHSSGRVLDAVNCAQPAVLVTSNGNTVDVEIKNAGDAACEIAGGVANSVTLVRSTANRVVLRIRDGSDNLWAVLADGGGIGVEITGKSRGNRTRPNGITIISSPAQYGVWLHGPDVTGNRVIADVTKAGSHGIVLGDGAHHNDIGGVTAPGSHSNGGHGVFLSGGAHHNTVTGGFSAGHEIKDNGGHGVFLSEGANNNKIDVVVQKNRGDGVRLEGRGTEFNVISGLFWGNGGSGLTMAGGAAHNVAQGGQWGEGVYAWANQEHGILLVGGGTDHNEVLSPIIVWQQVWGGVKDGNAQYGIAIVKDDSGTPQSTVVRRSESNAPPESRNNGKGGILVRGPAKGTVIEDVRVSGSDTGIVLEGAEEVTLRSPVIVTRLEGIHVHSGTSGVVLEGGGIISTESIGVLLDEVSNVRLAGVLISQCGASGVVLRNARDCWLGARGNLNGNVQVNKGDGIRVEAGCERTTVSRQNVSRNVGHGIVIAGSRTEVQVCSLQQNGGDGVRIEAGAVATKVGGFASARNFIDGSGGWGVNVVDVAAPVGGDGQEFNVEIAGNLIGVFPRQGDEGPAMPNVKGGVGVQNGCERVFIGGDGQSGNWIAGNAGPAIQVEGQRTRLVEIHGNFIGLDEATRVAQPNKGHGIVVRAGAQKVHIGSLRPNVVCASAGDGIHLSDVMGAVVESNYVGTDETGLLTRGNQGRGIALENVQFASLLRNQVAYSGQGGIELSRGSANNMLRDNTITFSETFGVVLWGGTDRNTVLRGSIHSNKQGGIKAALPPPPRITQVRSGKVLGDIPDTVPSGSLVQVYADRGQQGRQFLGQTQARGKAWRLEAPVPPGLNVTATVTDPNGSTSSFGGYTIGDHFFFGEQLVVFTSTRDGNTEIYKREPGETVDTRLTTEPAADHSPALSRDGSQIAFVSERSGNPEVWLMDALGILTARLTDHPAPDYDPAWSPDDAKVAFVSERDGNPEIYLMNADGTGLQRLTNSPGVDRHPSWSADGTKITFTSDRAGNPDVWVMGADGSNPSRLTNHAAADYDPVWSPDGTKIAFASERDGKAVIYLMNADGSNQTGLVEGTDPAWSPNGEWVALTSAQLGDAEIFARQVAGAKVERLTVSLGTNRQPAWGAGFRQ